MIIQESRNAYYATGHPCACPDDLMRNGRRCGGTSAYIPSPEISSLILGLAVAGSGLPSSATQPPRQLSGA
jgi:hypothetical protein